jgi:hypothetical protein
VVVVPVVVGVVDVVVVDVVVVVVAVVVVPAANADAAPSAARSEPRTMNQTPRRIASVCRTLPRFVRFLQRKAMDQPLSAASSCARSQRRTVTTSMVRTYTSAPTLSRCPPT